MSKLIVSPSRTAAIGPPTNASGATWPGHQAARGAAEAAVGEQRHGLAQALADDAPT